MRRGNAARTITTRLFRVDLRSRRTPPAAIGRALVSAILIVCIAGCGAAPSSPDENSRASIGQFDASTGRITLTPQSVGRIGIRTTAVRATADGNVIPYAALIYDTRGETFAYANPEPQVYLRHRIRVKAVRGDQIVLEEGPAAGAVVVIVGASQLLGFELGIGS